MLTSPSVESVAYVRPAVAYMPDYPPAKTRKRHARGDELIRAAASRDIDTVKRLILHSGVDPNYQGAGGTTALIKAAAYADPVILKFLLSCGADVNMRDDQGNTALTLAAYNGKSTLTRLLLASGADCNSTDETETTPLMWACISKSKESVESLVSAGSRLTTKNICSATPLGLAKAARHKPIAMSLFKSIHSGREIKPLLSWAQALSMLGSACTVKGLLSAMKMCHNAALGSDIATYEVRRVFGRRKLEEGPSDATEDIWTREVNEYAEKIVYEIEEVRAEIHQGLDGVQDHSLETTPRDPSRALSLVLSIEPPSREGSLMDSDYSSALTTTPTYLGKLRGSSDLLRSPIALSEASSRPTSFRRPSSTATSARHSARGSRPPSASSRGTRSTMLLAGKRVVDR